MNSLWIFMVDCDTIFKEIGYGNHFGGKEVDKVNFTVCLAGVPVGITAMYHSTKGFCQDYLTEEEPLFSLEVMPGDIAFEREKSAREDEYEGFPIRQFSDRYLETLAVYRKIVDKMLDFGILLFHGSVVAVDGAAYLFTAKSGTGKSTHTRLWRELLGDRAVMVNDDKPLLCVAEEGVTVFGTPWDGKHHLSSNIAVPLRAICILERGEGNRIWEVSPRDAWPMLMQQSYRSGNPEKLARTMDFIDQLAAKVHLYRMACNMDLSAAEMSYHKMRESH
ncbi:MAG: hypothetical protein HFH38_03380 [Lachnospiraceae bacterium]|nr:hypothetical protein [Lachnospiraceae bacterium]